MSLVLNTQLSYTFFIMQCCQKHFKQTCILIRSILALVVSLHHTTITLASVLACHPASYGPLSRPQALQKGTLITSCLLQALQAVGPKLMTCQALLKQEHINVSVFGWRAGQKWYTRGEDQGDYLGEQRIMPMQKTLREHTVCILIEI